MIQKYDPSEERDSRGEWTSGGDSARSFNVEPPSRSDPHIASLGDEKGDRLHELYTKAAEDKPTFDAILGTVANKVGGDLKAAPLKGTRRAVEKIKTDYNGDPNKIKDLLRATIVVDTAEQARQAGATIREKMEVLPSGSRDLITEPPPPTLGPDGYRDIKFNVRTSSGVVAEVQVNLRQMLAAKEEVHSLYVQRSHIERAAAHSEFSRADETKITELNNRMFGAYNEAWTRALRASKVAKSMGVPFRWADSASNGRGGTVSQAAHEKAAPGMLPNDTGVSSTSKKYTFIDATIDEILKAFNEDEARNSRGEWTSGGDDREKWPDHIKALRIPPAWSDVHYSTDPGAKLQATGMDKAGRKQYVYSKEFSKTQAEAKFGKIQELNSKFDAITKENEGNLKSKDESTREHALVTKLVMTTGIRPGSEEETGAKVKAYGATTLEGRHVKTDANGNTRLEFVGKKGVSLSIPVTDKDLAASLQARADKVGSKGQLFSSVSDRSLRDYTHTLDGGSIKTKDFRTLLGTRTAMDEIKGMKMPNSDTEYKRAVLEVAKRVSTKLGNTPSVALSSYISPVVWSSWQASMGGMR